MDESIFSRVLLENSVASYCWFAGIILLGIVFKKFISVRISRFIFSFLKKHAEGVERERFSNLLIRPINLLILLIFIYAAFSNLKFPDGWHLAHESVFGLRMILLKFYKVLVIISLSWIVLRTVDFFSLVLLYKSKQRSTKSNDQLIPFMKEGVKILLVIFSFFIILGSVFEVNIASIIAGLGIGGLAIALAAKETLENLLGSFTIFMDKPFVIGDHVKVGVVNGTVEKIGFRSTRIRTPEKSYVTVPNKKMVDAETENLTMRTSRRLKLDVRLSYSTSESQLKKILEGIRNSLENNSSINRNDIEVRFVALGSHGLELKVDCYALVKNNSEFLEIKEWLNFSIMETVAANGSAFAAEPNTFPAQR